jgi:hypothetical protein
MRTALTLDDRIGKAQKTLASDITFKGLTRYTSTL